jgi:hypothetical protein
MERQASRLSLSGCRSGQSASWRNAPVLPFDYSSCHCIQRRQRDHREGNFLPAHDDGMLTHDCQPEKAKSHMRAKNRKRCLPHHDQWAYRQAFEEGLEPDQQCRDADKFHDTNDSQVPLIEGRLEAS